MPLDPVVVRETATILEGRMCSIEGETPFVKDPVAAHREHVASVLGSMWNQERSPIVLVDGSWLPMRAKHELYRRVPQQPEDENEPFERHGLEAWANDVAQQPGDVLPRSGAGRQKESNR
jgi:hypothetical protein